MFGSCLLNLLPFCLMHSTTQHDVAPFDSLQLPPSGTLSGASELLPLDLAITRSFSTPRALTLNEALTSMKTVLELCRLSEESARVQSLYGGGAAGNSLMHAFRQAELVEDLVLRVLPLPSPSEE